MKTRLYYESHVTLEPIAVDDDASLAMLRETCRRHGFRLAQLYMKKGATFEPHHVDQFCTARDDCYERITLKTAALIAELRSTGRRVLRYKIEETLLDSREENDPLDLLG